MLQNPSLTNSKKDLPERQSSLTLGDQPLQPSVTRDDHLDSTVPNQATARIITPPPSSPQNALPSLQEELSQPPSSLNSNTNPLSTPVSSHSSHENTQYNNLSNMPRYETKESQPSMLKSARTSKNANEGKYT